MARAVEEVVNEEVEAGDLRHVVHCPTCGDPLIAEPQLSCAHCNSLVPLRSFVYEPRKGEFIAECIDLNILSQGSSPEEAIGRLQEAMFSYLDVAFDGPVAGLVLRPSPYSHRLRYWLYRLRLWLPFGDRRSKHLLWRGRPSEGHRLSHC
jgi:hypothetical protein